MSRNWIAGTLLLGLLACVPASDKEPATEETTMGQELTIADAISLHAEGLIAIEGVAMVFEGQDENGEPCIKIGLVEENEALRASLPTELEGFPVVIEISGEIRPMHDR